jgi:beta-aspartyl-peptidase (threonine type)
MIHPGSCWEGIVKRRVTDTGFCAGRPRRRTGRQWRRVLVLLPFLLVACSGPPPEHGVGAPGGENFGWAIAIHGGAGAIPKEMDPQRKTALEESLETALRLGTSVLQEGGTSLDAVERVIVFLEDDSQFNAGRGAVFNHEGRHELDASIMDGNTLACGAVAGVRNVRNPISLARAVMRETPHVLLGAGGAEALAAELGLEPVDQDYFYTQERWERLQRALARDPGGGGGGGTVGAAALDVRGNLAAGTSTGGLTNKRVGRIGDTPIVGAGTYADNRTCAVSCTGKGEEFIRHNVAARVAALMEYRGLSLQEAAEQVVHGRLKSGEGGLIAVAHDGSIAMVFNTPGMYRGAADSGGRFEVSVWE